jgi:hypothetical protein
LTFINRHGVLAEEVMPHRNFADGSARRNGCRGAERST